MPHHWQCTFTALLALVSVGSARAAECDGARTLYATEFEYDGGGTGRTPFIGPAGYWFHDSSISIGGGKLAIKPPSGDRWEIAEYLGLDQLHSIQPSTEVCVDVRFPADVQDGVQAGIVFWSVFDRRHVWDCYVFLVSSFGWATLSRMNDSQFQKPPIFDSQTPAVRTGANEVNSLRVQFTSHDRINFFVNGQPVGAEQHITQPNADSAKVGLFGYQMPSRPPVAPIEFWNFWVTAPN